jgi:DNA-directed RNA polymerase subunit RPC12/RpoP
MLHGCRWCTRRFRLVAACWAHEKHCVQRDPGGVCSVCSKTFTRLHNARRHEREAHGDDMDECEHCGYIAMSGRQLKQHLRNSRCARIRGIATGPQWPA